MSDLIDRQVAIDELDKGAWGVEWDKTLAKTMIESLPSAQPTQPNDSNTLNALDCISRQAAIDALGEEPEVWTGKDEYAQGLNNQWHYDKTAILAVPSAQPEIIRCKDCKYYHPSYCKVWSKFGTIQTRETGFCYMAERKDNG